MNTRLQQFLSAEGLTQAQFADTLGVARASISHILAGRNNPGYDFFISIARNYPELNLEWLLLGKGRMYKNQGTEEPSLFTPITEIPANQYEPKQNFEATIEMDASKNTIQETANQRTISKIIVFYDDNSFQEFH